jgi:hypothetical protein
MRTLKAILLVLVVGFSIGAGLDGPGLDPFGTHTNAGSSMDPNGKGSGIDPNGQIA